MKAATYSFFILPPCIKISIHAAREGGDFYVNKFAEMFFRISIHAAREGGDFEGFSFESALSISIHAAREGGDNIAFHFISDLPLFQSTPPVKAATQLRG